MNIQKRSLLLGMLLGDGCLKTKTHKKQNGDVSVYYEFVIAHSSKQKEYLEYKRNLFHKLMGGKLPKLNYESRTDSFRFSRAHKIFRLFHRILYSNNNKKYFTDKVFRYLTPQSIAIWYMDDGGLSKNKNNGKITSCEMRLYTYFSKEEANRAIKYFKTVYDINVKKRHYMNRNQYNLIFNTKESFKLEVLISDFIIDSMKYKLPSYNITRAPDSLNNKDDDIV